MKRNIQVGLDSEKKEWKKEMIQCGSMTVWQFDMETGYTGKLKGNLAERVCMCRDLPCVRVRHQMRHKRKKT